MHAPDRIGTLGKPLLGQANGGNTDTKSVFQEKSINCEILATSYSIYIVIADLDRNTEIMPLILMET